MPPAEAIPAPHGAREMPAANVGLSAPQVAEVVRALARGQGAQADGVDAVFAAEMLFQV